MAQSLANLFRLSALVSALFAAPAIAGESLVTISAPADGEKLAAGKAYKVDYAVAEGTKAHHVHLFVDGKEVETGHKLKGSFALGPFTAGGKTVCVVAVNKNHTPLGDQSCVSVTVQ